MEGDSEPVDAKETLADSEAEKADGEKMPDNTEVEEGSKNKTVSINETPLVMGNLSGESMKKYEESKANGKLFEAVDALNTVIEESGISFDLLHKRCLCYILTNELELALKDAKKMLKLEPDNLLALILKGDIYREQNKLPLSVSTYAKAREKYPEQEKMITMKIEETKASSFISQVILKYKKMKRRPLPAVKNGLKSKPSYTQPPPVPKKNRKPGPRKFLGELFNDKKYLEELLKDESIARDPAEVVQSPPRLRRRGRKKNIMPGKPPATEAQKKVFVCLKEGLSFLEDRLSYWKETDKRLTGLRGSRLSVLLSNHDLSDGFRPGTEETLLDEKDPNHAEKIKRRMDEKRQIVIQMLEDIYKQLKTPESVEEGLQNAKDFINDFKDSEIPDTKDFCKDKIISELWSLQGDCYRKMEEKNLASAYYQKALTVAKATPALQALQVKHLDSLGGMFFEQGNYSSAMKFYEEKMPFVTSPIELSHIHFVMGMAKLHTNHFKVAFSCGEKAKEYAEQGNNPDSMVNACLLLGQVYGKLNDFQTAVDTFEEGLQITRQNGNEEMAQRISAAMEDLNSKVVESLMLSVANQKNVDFAASSNGDTNDVGGGLKRSSVTKKFKTSIVALQKMGRLSIVQT
eukprot:Nk52_evm5s2171 gene=Nk52_evmTU5s2171